MRGFFLCPVEAAKKKKNLSKNHTNMIFVSFYQNIFFKFVNHLVKLIS